MEQGMDPEVRKYFRKIINSLSFGLLWLALNVLAGFYWEFALIGDHLSLTNILFFTWVFLSLGLLLWYYYRTWRNIE